MSDDSHIYSLAEDLAAASNCTLDDAVDALRQNLTGVVPPIVKMKRLPWYLRLVWRWVPIRQQQRWILKSIRESSKETPE